MPQKQNSNIDEDLRQRVGHDATSDFESDPRFTNNIPTANASSENLGARNQPDQAIGATRTAEAEDEADYLASSPESSADDILDDTAQDRPLQPLGNRTASQDETRLEGASQSARSRGNRKTPRQAA